jgi:hypothetical protein
MCLLAACSGNQQESSNNQSDLATSVIQAHNIERVQPEKSYGIEGYYTGFFEAVTYDGNKDYMYSNKITVSIDSITETTLFGHSIVAGNDRPFSGSYQVTDKVWKATVAEPGDDRYDGVFTFQLNSDSMVLIGTWTANNQKLAVSKRKYKLESSIFSYNPAIDLPEEVTYDAIKINPSNTLLKKEDIENMFQGDLEVMRNSIYARHGYSFRNRRMRFLFDQMVEWYMPVSINITNELTELEKKNIELLKRYEAHAEKYYDTYGR